MKCLIDRDVDGLLDLYDFGTPDEPLLFKPTLADVIRLDREGARSYFVGGDPHYPNDHGFPQPGYTSCFPERSRSGYRSGRLGYMDMGQYTFVDGEGNATTQTIRSSIAQLDGRAF